MLTYMVNHLLFSDKENTICLIFLFRYRTIEGSEWTELSPTNQTLAVVDQLEAGERYIIQVRSVSHHVESFSPQEVEQIVREYSRLSIEYFSKFYFQRHKVIQWILDVCSLTIHRFLDLWIFGVKLTLSCHGCL